MPSAFHEKSPDQKYFAEKGFFFTLKTTKIYIAVEFSQKITTKQVAQKWPVGTQRSTTGGPKVARWQTEG